MPPVPKTPDGNRLDVPQLISHAGRGVVAGLVGAVAAGAAAPPTPSTPCSSTTRPLPAGPGAPPGAVTVLVSHRFSTVRLADLIVVVDGGGVREQGTHAELMAAGGIYAELYGIQARASR